MVIVLATTLAAGILGWAVATVFAPRQSVVDETSYTSVEVTEGVVGSSISLSAVAEWERATSGVSMASGTVTSIPITPGQEVTVGSVIFTVDLRAVVVAQGSVPSFRTLSEGATGADVAQLQQFLATLGVFGGEADGRFGALTAAAVEAWQVSRGLEADGVVLPGDILYLPALPARVVLDAETVFVGATLSGGARVLSILAAAPHVTISVSESQSAAMPDGTQVELTGPRDEVWRAVVASRSQDDDGTVTLGLDGKDGGAVCGGECGTIDPMGPTTLDASVILVETVSGLVVPSAALTSAEAGEVVLVGVDGTRHPVTVVASARGMSVVTGVPAGLSVRIPAGD